MAAVRCCGCDTPACDADGPTRVPLVEAPKDLRHAARACQVRARGFMSLHLHARVRAHTMEQKLHKEIEEGMRVRAF